VSCGRYDEAHALGHFETTHHPLALSLTHLNAWCYECDQEVPMAASKAVKECVRAARRALLGETHESSSSDDDGDKADGYNDDDYGEAEGQHKSKSSSTTTIGATETGQASCRASSPLTRACRVAC
jgi:uncharacterized UBP type Zn finger protein